MPSLLHSKILRAVGRQGLVVLVSSVLLLAACGNGEVPDGFEQALSEVTTDEVVTNTTGGSASDVDVDADADVDTSETDTVHAGFDLELQVGSWWEFGFWRSEQSFSQGSGSRGSETTGRFRVSLGAERAVGGVTLYDVQIVPTDGDSPEFDVMRWSSIGVDGGDLVGSVDGTNLETILAATAGFQAGGGFFATFSSDELITSDTGLIDNEFVQSPAVVLRSGFEEGRCEYFASVGNICTGERDTSFSRLDYFQPGVGPLGHTYSFQFEDCGGGFCSGASEQIRIGLVDHSLIGEGPLPDPVADPGSPDVGYVTLVDDTGSLHMDVPVGWVDTTTRVYLDEDGMELPTIAAAPSLDDFLGAYSGSGILFQAVPVAAAENLSGALDSLTAEDALVCTTGETEQFSGANHRLARRVLMDCDDTDTDLVWIVGELDRPDTTVVVVVQLAVDADRVALETMVSSLRQLG